MPGVGKGRGRTRPRDGCLRVVPGEDSRAPDPWSRLPLTVTPRSGGRLSREHRSRPVSSDVGLAQHPSGRL